jgi:hypothetical protein
VNQQFVCVFITCVLARNTCWCFKRSAKLCLVVLWVIVEKDSLLNGAGVRGFWKVIAYCVLVPVSYILEYFAIFIRDLSFLLVNLQKFFCLCKSTCECLSRVAALLGLDVFITFEPKLRFELWLIYLCFVDNQLQLLYCCLLALGSTLVLKLS